MHEPKTSVKDVLLHETCKQKSLEYEEVKQFDKLSKIAATFTFSKASNLDKKERNNL